MLVAKQRKEEIERQNEAALRLAKQQQELELERLQEEQELLRLGTDRLKKEQALRVEQLEEENRKKLAEATLTELELTDDLSDSQSEFLDTMSQIAASTKADDAVRVSEWVNNSPVATANDPTNTGISNPNAVAVTNVAQNSVNRGAPTTTSSPSTPVVTSVAPPAGPMINNIPLVRDKVQQFSYHLLAQSKFPNRPQRLREQTLHRQLLQHRPLWCPPHHIRYQLSLFLQAIFSQTYRPGPSRQDQVPRM